eukprot:6467233-Amphidinium_carterae.1
MEYPTRGSWWHFKQVTFRSLAPVAGARSTHRSHRDCIFTTFSGTMMGTAILRDVFEGQELTVRTARASSTIGLAIMAGPLAWILDDF